MTMAERKSLIDGELRAEAAMYGVEESCKNLLVKYIEKLDRVGNVGTLKEYFSNLMIDIKLAKIDYLQKFLAKLLIRIL